ncbi:asparaginyl-tRNA synthetase [Owenweeksia hongkongensis DSM 17368]|uniref:Asparagine--tRNA ligase n=1 Tax=Owenweeksia hongkongensis (strain DSM 17368 / CIP 108786 / JCM 12287 / NRRL B-23963 / UST20020801) TaxID=926562 RepID=G8R4Q4_OWEHD|nr:asparagine--tRNA ligase [Owenweeksia hongkongensis]AEV33178.1 asparaginyl-tRNA synthetase [Owenweeksia hongkongensis DSM 17368]
MDHISIKELLSKKPIGTTATVKGWVRNFRSNRFIALSDGSTIKTLQAVVNFENTPEEVLKKITVGACIKVTGDVVSSQGAGQDLEIQATGVAILGESNPEEYPLQPKKHSMEFLREKAHLRPRTNTFGAVLRIRHSLSFAIHQYFHERGFYNMHTPIITGSDAEGAGEMFNVSALDKKNIPLTEDGEVDFSEDFFGKETNLTVSGQLEAELGALALGKVYTFGPTFRAENSNTTRHLAEFWMIEPEVAFADLDDNMDLAEDFLRKVIKFALDNCADDIEFLSKRLEDEEKTKPQAERSEMSLKDRLEFVADNNFRRVSYTEAVEILRNSKPNKKKKFQYLINEWGVDLQSEHEKFLVKHFGCPVILYDYPATIKAFYMRLNDDEKTVRAMDILFPGIGEIVGGSQREERHDVLLQKMEEFGIDPKELWWYLDTRKFGTCVHSGFGLGFERLVLFVTGMTNIRDVIPFPRTPGNADF